MTEGQGLKKNKHDHEHVYEKEKQTSSSNAHKNQWKIELGWMHFSLRSEQFVQVQTKKGGGSRKQCVPKDSKKQGLIDKAGQQIFP